MPEVRKVRKVLVLEMLECTLGSGFFFLIWQKLRVRENEDVSMSEETRKCEWKVGHAVSDILMEGKSLLFLPKDPKVEQGNAEQTLVKKARPIRNGHGEKG